MPTRSLRRSALCRAAVVVSLAGTAIAFADVYDAPAGYYAGATGTGATLKSQLNTIIKTGFISRSYDAARQALQLTDVDPTDSNNIILYYTGIPNHAFWDSGVTWNREHTWPQSLGVGSSGSDSSDLHMLRPTNPSVNSSRGNKPYGIGAGYWDPNQNAGVHYRGESARAIFYMATRYDGTETNTVALTIVNGMPGTNQMGDLAKLLEWHFSEPVSEHDRVRNHVVYSQAANPSFYQNNRNPFVDHPEYVWAIWGTSPNNSTIYVGGAPAGNGSSSINANLGTVIVGASISNQNVTISKSGTNPTTFDVTASGAAVSASAVPRQAFIGGAQSQVISVGVTGAVTPGLYAGTITVDNTDLTSGGAGQGVADGNDTVNVSASVLAHSNASFATPADQNTLTVNLGQFRQGTGPHGQSITINNLVSSPGFTAALDIDSVNGSGDVAVMGTDLAPTSAILAGAGLPADVWIDSTTAIGTYQAVYTIAVSDQNLPGATAGASLTLTVTGEVICFADFDGNGYVNGDDFDGFTEAFYFGYPSADLDYNEFPNADDYDAFLEAFFVGC